MTPTPTPAERFWSILEGLKKVVAAANAQKMPGAWIILIWNKISRISQQAARISTLVRDGKYHPRQSSGKPRKPTTLRKPRPVQLSYRRGWLLRALPMIPGAQGAAPWRGYLETLLQDPEMVALIAAAPTLVRPIRSLCFMLYIPPPPILALPVRPRPASLVATSPEAAAPAATPRASALPTPPQTASRPRRKALGRKIPPPARGPPLPA